MQQFSDAGLENWHDFEVESRREIVALLRGIGEKKQLIRMLIQGEADVCVTSILDVDPDNNTLILDCSINKEQNQRIVAAKRISFETTLDKIRILFSADSVKETTFENGPALKTAIPASLVRLQRREYYRMATPVSNPVRALIPMPAELGGGTNVFPLADISCGGIAILDNKLLLGNTIGDNYPGCRIDLPDVGTVTTTLQIRNSIDLTLLNAKTNRRLGCEFIDISRGNLAYVQRYITKLERERNARIAGLS
ncbi:MAG TPA: flagellar brake protein [Telluria sp.]|nr:flagellar brake protein [Telluria sp.]